MDKLKIIKIINNQMKKLSLNICITLHILLLFFSFLFVPTISAKVQTSLQWQIDFDKSTFPLGIDDNDAIHVFLFRDLSSAEFLTYTEDNVLFASDIFVFDIGTSFKIDKYGTLYFITTKSESIEIRKYSEELDLVDTILINRTINDQSLIDIHISEKGHIYGTFFNFTETSSSFNNTISILQFNELGGINWNSSYVFSNRLQPAEPLIHLSESLGNTVFIGIEKNLYQIDVSSGVNIWQHDFSTKILSIKAVETDIFVVYSDTSLAYSPSYEILISHYNEIKWEKTWENLYGFVYFPTINYNGKFIGINREISGIKDSEKIKKGEFILLNREGGIELNHSISNPDPEEEINTIKCYVTSKDKFYEAGFYIDENDNLQGFIKLYSFNIETRSLTNPFYEIMFSSLIAFLILQYLTRKKIRYVGKK
ncbi:MAG: hypothetical protein V3V41_00550 [Candidatus Heimdallarchaeota archaeon]